MTSSGVSNVLNSLAAPKGNGPGKVRESGGEFQEIFKNAAPSPEQSAPKMSPEREPSGVHQESYDKAKNEAGYKEAAKVEKPKAETELTEEQAEKLKELEEKVAETIAGMLDVSAAEVLSAMESLGITMENLLMGNGLADLVKQLTGAEDMTALLFDGNFKNLMQQLQTMVQEFARENGMTETELKQMLQKLAAEVNAEAEANPEAEVSENAKTAVSGEEVFQAKPEEAVQKQEAAANPNTQQAAGSKEAAPEVKSGLQQGGQESADFGNKQNLEPKTAEAQPVTYQNTETTVRSVGNELVQTVERVFVDAEEILRQVTEFTRVSVTESQSSMEMQLNPAHLGKIYLQVISKDGMITAQLAAQNEAVKQAIESQAAVLRENLSQQGIKVEAVEVTIASHEFEQNLEGQQGQKNREQQEDSAGKSRRFLTAEALDTMTDLTEEEALTAKMMLEQGNQMDMTV